MMTDTGESEELFIMAAAQAGTNIKTPKKNQNTNCQSCEAELTGAYCVNCGQKNDDLRRSLWRLITESLGGIFSFESRMWKTWGALLTHPGKVAREYADGARTRFSPPIRVYIVVSFLFFSFIAFTDTNFLSFEVAPRNTSSLMSVSLPTNSKSTSDTEKPVEQLTPLELKAKQEAEDKARERLKQAQVNIKNTIKELSQSKALQGSNVAEIETSISDLEEKLNSLGKEMDELDTAFSDFFNRYKFNVQLFMPDHKLYKMSEQELEEFSKVITDDSNITVNDQSVDLRQMLQFVLVNPKKFNSTFNTILPRVMFFMVPFAMLLGWVFIRGKNAMLYDHLIHATYVHSVFFLALLATIVLARVMPGDIAFLGLIAVLLIYLPLSMKSMFGRGWIKSIWAAFGTGFLYSLILFLTLTTITVYSILKVVIDSGLTTG
jgi:hypothetical protein